MVMRYVRRKKRTSAGISGKRVLLCCPGRTDPEERAPRAALDAYAWEPDVFINSANFLHRPPSTRNALRRRSTSAIDEEEKESHYAEHGKTPDSRSGCRRLHSVPAVGSIGSTFLFICMDIYEISTRVCRRRSEAKWTSVLHWRREFPLGPAKYSIRMVLFTPLWISVYKRYFTNRKTSCPALLLSTLSHSRARVDQVSMRAR